MSDLDAVVGAGTLRSGNADAVTFPHRWTAEGVTVEVAFTFTTPVAPRKGTQPT
jgi:hypothetical protein